MKNIVLLIFFFTAILCVDPPIYNHAFRIAFDETFITNTTKYQVNGQTLYDPANNRERVDRSNGRYDLFCGGVLPNVTTPCIQYTANNKRFIAHPQRQQCCFCCEGSKGCGILKPNWMADGKYMGQEQIVDTNYDKWSKDGDFGYNYLFVTADANKIMRRLDQSGTHITDYLTHTYVNQTFPDSVFALPAYCNQAAPTNCPLTSICGQLRTDINQE